MLRKLFSNPTQTHFELLARFVNLAYKHTSAFRKDALPSSFIFSKQVEEALLNHRPIVALESTIISHGMPYPQNVETAVQVESIIRENGSIPATIAILEGRIHVGLSPSNLEKLGRMGAAAKKTSRRDLAMVVSQGLTGATTVSSTMLLAHQAGIKIFVTGGIGGVHRGAELSMDVSADLTELGRTPITVVCAGAKSILDIGKTMEYLETQGVTVTTYGNSNEFPAFFTPRSGFMSPWTVSTPESAAAMIYANQMLELSSGIVLAVPIPEEYAEIGQPIQEAINTAILEAREKDVHGKDETPFLLRRINELTGGESLKSNIALVKNNAAVGSQIAVRLTELQFSKEQPTKSHNTFARLSVASSIKPKYNYENNEPKNKPLMIIGGTVIDITSTISPSITSNDSPSPSYMHTSMRGRVQQTLGGVGRNIAETAWRIGAPTVFISVVGGDIGGQWARKSFEEIGMDSSYLMKIESEMTAVYNALHDSKGQLISAVADMNIFDTINPEELRDKIRTIRPSLICIDGNVSGSVIHAISDECAKLQIPAFFEPTSVPKSVRLFDHLETLLSGAIRYASPNEFELEAMSQHAKELGLEKYLRKEEFKLYNKAEWLEAFPPDLHSHIAHAYYLSHFIPCLIIKLGQNGVLFVEKDHMEPTFTHIKAPQIDSNEIRNVTGAGDSFVGALLANLHRHGVSISSQDSNVFSNILMNAQKAAVMTLKSDLAVSVEIGPELGEL